MVLSINEHAANFCCYDDLSGAAGRATLRNVVALDVLNVLLNLALVAQVRVRVRVRACVRACVGACVRACVRACVHLHAFREPPSRRTVRDTEHLFVICATCRTCCNTPCSVACRSVSYSVVATRHSLSQCVALRCDVPQLRDAEHLAYEIRTWAENVGGRSR